MICAILGIRSVAFGQFAFKIHRNKIIIIANFSLSKITKALKRFLFVDEVLTCFCKSTNVFET